MDSFRRRSRLMAQTLWVLTAIGVSGSADESASPAQRQLQAAGIGTDRQGIETYLKLLHPDAERQRQVKLWIAQLGDADFRVRSAATKRLARLPVPPVAELRRAAKSADREVSVRAERLLQQAERGDFVTLQLAVLTTIHERKIKGLTGLLLKLIPTWTQPVPFRTAKRALSATAATSDLPALKQAMAPQSDRHVRIAALAAYTTVFGKQATDELLKLLEDGDDRVRLEAAVGLAGLKDRRCLQTLLTLLESNEMLVRIRAASVLRSMTGKQFGYVAYAKPAQRAESAAKWKKWIDGAGKTARLHLPNRKFAMETGRTVYAIWSERKIIEIDRNGKRTFEAGGYTYIWGCQGLPNGHRLAVDMSQKAVVEYDAQGKVVWRKDRLPGGPTSVERLPGGNTLMALPNSGKVVEINRAGKVVWDVELKGRPTCAQRLENGLTVVNLQYGKQVVDVDRQGNIVRTLTGPRNALTAQRLPGGNTLVCDMGASKVVEFDPNGKVVWSKSGLQNPAQAQRIANGNTLVSDNNGLHEFDRQGREVWHYRTSRGKFHRY